MTPERFRTAVSLVLLGGVSASAALIAAAFVASLAVGWDGSLVGAAAGTAARTDFGGMVASLGALRPIGIAQLGLVVLLATPVLRVATSMVGFALEGDRVYAVLTAVVLGVLLTSIFVLR